MFLLWHRSRFICTFFSSLFSFLFCSNLLLIYVHSCLELFLIIKYLTIMNGLPKFAHLSEKKVCILFFNIFLQFSNVHNFMIKVAPDNYLFLISAFLKPHKIYRYLFFIFVFLISVIRSYTCLRQVYLNIKLFV